MLQWIKSFWWAGRNHEHLRVLIMEYTQQMRMNALMIRQLTQDARSYRQEVDRLTRQGEHDALMLQAYANWCAAHGVTPSVKDLEHASGKRKQ